MSILNSVCPRAVERPDGTPTLGIEILDGPYRGVVFSYKSFNVQSEKEANGMVPMKFDTEVLKAPRGFRADESFDQFCGEVIVAMLEYLSRAHNETD